MDKFEKILKRTTIFSKNTMPEKRGATEELFKEFLVEQKEEVRSFDGESEKTQEQIEMINIAIELINRELEEIKINDKFEFPIERIHFLPLSAFKKINNEEKDVQVVGEADTLRNEIRISENLDRSALLNSLVHELIHMASYEKYYINVNNVSDHDDNDDESLRINIKNRIGYHFVGSDIKPDMNLLAGLNNMVTEKITIGICKKYKHEIKKRVNLSRKEIKNLVDDSYLKRDPREILNLIIEEIARVKKEKIGDVWKRFERGYFTGEMMHLRDIERVFGVKALKVLSVLGFYDTDDDEEKVRNNENKILTYFITEDKSRREKIFEEIFNSVESKRKDEPTNKLNL